MPIHPKNGALEEMASRNSEEPIVMLNLLRFREQAESGLPLIHLCGFLAFAAPGNPLMERNLAAIRRSTAEFELLTAEETTARFPALRISPLAVACLTPQAGFLDADRCVMAHLSEAQRLGAAIHGRVTIESLDFARGRSTVRTNIGDFRADRVVVTAGPWTADCLRDLGLPLTVTRQQKFYFRPTTPASLRPSSLPVYADYETRFYGFPLHGPGIKVADDTRGARLVDSTGANGIARALGTPERRYFRNTRLREHHARGTSRAR